MYKILFLVFISFFLFSCENREKNCERAYFNMMELGIIDNGDYELNQERCIKDKNYDPKFLDCLIDATSKEEAYKCKQKIKPPKFS